MKKGLYLLLMIAFLMPLRVWGATANFTVDCNETVKKGGTISCTLKADVAPELEEKLKQLEGSILLDNVEVQPLTETDLDIVGTNKVVKTFTLTAPTTAGTSKVKVNLTKGLDDLDNDVVITNDNIEKSVKVLNNVTTIKGITVDKKDVCTSNLNDNSCTLDTIKKNSIEIGATLIDANAKISGTGTKELKCGNNTLTLTVTAEDGETNKKYTINANRVCDTDINLKGINVSAGSLNPTFAQSTKTYTVNVTSDIDKITITGTKNNNKQTITGEVKDKALQFGENKFTLTVKAENGATSSYTITVNREDNRDTNNYLSEITLSDGKILFDKETQEYKVRVLHDVTKMTVNGKAESEKAKVKIENNSLTLKDGLNNPIVIKVTSEQGSERIYKITVERLLEGETLGDNPNLTNLVVQGYDLGFNYNKTDYTLKIKDEENLTIIPTVEEKTTEFQVKGNNNLQDGDVITISTISADGTTKDYRIVIEKDNNLILIIIIALIGLAALGGIIYLLIKNKKDKDKITTDTIKLQLHEQDMLKQAANEEQKLAKEPVNQYGPTTPLSINTGINQNNNQTPNTASSIRQATRYQEYPEPNNNRFDFNAYREEEPEIKEQPVVLENKDATKVCSICGHRVSASLKTCPYCKRNF